MTDDTGEIGPSDLQTRIDAGGSVRVLDVRDRDEVERWRLSGPGVTLTQKPYNRFLQARVTDDLAGFADDVDGEGPITVVCARGEASGEVAQELADAGVEARNLAGGMEGWARLLLAVEIEGVLPDAPEATLVQYRRPSSGCLGYALVAGGEAAVVDPLRAFTDRYVADVGDRGAEITTVVDTHVHADHVSGLRALADATGATPVMPAPAVERGVTYDVETVDDGDAIAVGEASLAAVHAPGHTTGMTAFAVGDALLSGDSLFTDSAVGKADRDGSRRRSRLAGVARPDLEEGSDEEPAFARELYRTLTERFARFPDETLVAPGHHGGDAAPDDGGTVTARLDECRELPIFGLDEAEFVKRVTERTPPRPANHGEIIAVNLGRESADNAAAFELELGPNNCAAAAADD
ncbi:MBL fold metallo-hydrolase [Halosimplex rubrum]|uniref:MBL fold metallo-hydrolase n=1 Tax=Halosimplex rubrum TaxID=869889 RepID=A0A7D5SVL8_9EURY|nr:MBL fold metallo-hydrolase [Halosimplex rubrum]QLH75831.1 MBL fold metallo-hydrolase [Halosimplex rubrum]